MSEQDKTSPPTQWNPPYGEDPSLAELSIQNIEAILKTKYEEKKRPVPSSERMRKMAEIAHRRYSRKVKQLG